MVAARLEHFGAPRSIYDAIVASGDVTRHVIAQRRARRSCISGRSAISRRSKGWMCISRRSRVLDYVICTGLFHEDTETPDDYRPMLEAMRERALFMVCGNPDVVVERGDTVLYCAEAIADLYVKLGGEVLYACEPMRRFDDLALQLAQDARGKPARTQAGIWRSVIRCAPDFAGAAAYGIDCMFDTAGIHAAEFGGRDDPDPEAVEHLLMAAGGCRRAIARRLKW